MMVSLPFAAYDCASTDHGPQLAFLAAFPGEPLADGPREGAMRWSIVRGFAEAGRSTDTTN